MMSMSITKCRKPTISLWRLHIKTYEKIIIVFINHNFEIITADETGCACDKKNHI